MKIKAKTRYIVRDPEIFEGAPVIAGTRIPAIRLMALIRFGYTEQKMREEFPQVGVRKMRGALAELMEQGIEHMEEPERA